MRDHFPDVTAQQIPVTWAPTWVVNGHVDDGLQLIAHGVEYKRDAARFGFEQVAKGRVLLGVFALGEPRAFHEVEDTHRVIAELVASTLRGFQVFALLLRVFGQVRLGVTLHERKTQRPPGQANNRYPDQLLLEKELQRTDAPIEYVLQDHDVDPALMVAGNQVRVLIVQAFEPAQVPAGVAHQLHPGFVVADPGFVDVAHQPVGQALGGREGQAQLEDGDHEQRCAANDCVKRQKQRGNHASQWGRQKVHAGQGSKNSSSAAGLPGGCYWGQERLSA